jgi:UDP-2,3-diacylglucosamine pyrophosphatase LpxH
VAEFPVNLLSNTAITATQTAQCDIRRSANIPRHTLGKETVRHLTNSAAGKEFKALSTTATHIYNNIFVTSFSQNHNTRPVLCLKYQSTQGGHMHLNFRTLWISDTHLGGKNLKSDQLLDFLQKTESEYLYLVGDIFDIVKLKKKWYWPEINDHIVHLLLQKAQNGTKVIYLPGNHDVQFRNYTGENFNGIKICTEIIHESADGGRFLVKHGDEFDCVVQNSRWLANIGSFLYDALLVINRWYNNIRLNRGKSYFSISAYIKNKCKTAVNYMGSFEQVLINEIRKKKVDGIICGHIHNASIKALGKSLYSNTGDWVESCTALAENSNGTIGIIQWVSYPPVIEPAILRKNEKNRYSDRCLAPTN